MTLPLRLFHGLGLLGLLLLPICSAGQSSPAHRLGLEVGTLRHQVRAPYQRQFVNDPNRPGQATGIEITSLSMLSLGLTYQYEFHPRWSLELDGLHGQLKGRYLEEFWIVEAPLGTSFFDLPPTAPRRLQCTVLGLHLYWRLPLRGRFDLSAGTGLQSLWRIHAYRGGFVYDAVTEAFVSEERVEERVQSFGFPVHLRLRWSFTERWSVAARVGTSLWFNEEASGMAAIKLGYVLGR